MKNQRRRVHIKCYYDTDPEADDKAYIPYVRDQILTAFERQGMGSDRIKGLVVWVSKPHKDCHCATEACKHKKKKVE